LPRQTRGKFFPWAANSPRSYRDLCRVVATTITATIAVTIAAKLRQIFFIFYRDVFRAFMAIVTAIVTANIAATIAARLQQILFIFCRDFFRAIIATIAATITATLAGHFSAKTIEHFTANIYALVDAVIAANDTENIR
jgi:hypothetical protein